MRLDITNEGTFIPTFRDNDKDVSTDQIVVRYRVPTIAIKNRCRTRPQSKALADKDGKISGIEVIIDKDELQTLNEMLISISNCSYGTDSGKDAHITTARDLINAPIAFEPLLKEIVKEFDRVLDETEIDEKN
jgi:hypothetical protein